MLDQTEPLFQDTFLVDAALRSVVPAAYPEENPRAIEFSVQSVFPARVNAAGDAWVSNLDNRDGK